MIVFILRVINKLYFLFRCLQLVQVFFAGAMTSPAVKFSVLALAPFTSPQPVQMSSADAVPHWTKGLPTTGVAPNSIGAVTQISCVMVNVQEPFWTPGHIAGPGVTMGGPQQTVVVSPGKTKGVTVTGTQTVDG